MQLSGISLVSPQLDPSVIPKLPRVTPFLPGIQTSQVASVSKTPLPSEVQKGKEAGTHFPVTDPSKEK
jgi:hypothetical protein